MIPDAYRATVQPSSTSRFWWTIAMYRTDAPYPFAIEVRLTKLGARFAAKRMLRKAARPARVRTGAFEVTQ